MTDPITLDSLAVDARRDRLLRAMRYLYSHPTLFDAVLAACDLEDGLGYPTWGEADRRRARDFLATSTPEHCGRCSYPIVILPDGRVRNWPSLDRHPCDQTSPEFTPPSPPPRPATRPKVIEGL